ncbi:hypothetical protein BV20DRAFT_667335 [Pilatotrama ljubarskyi]|nr:hypothetical protein BV20DRAFT_667335 [Pilatotrama ljubarskyi]
MINVPSARSLARRKLQSASCIASHITWVRVWARHCTPHIHPMWVPLVPDRSGRKWIHTYVPRTTVAARPSSMPRLAPRAGADPANPVPPLRMPVPASTVQRPARSTRCPRGIVLELEAKVAVARPGAGPDSTTVDRHNRLERQNTRNLERAVCWYLPRNQPRAVGGAAGCKLSERLCSCACRVSQSAGRAISTSRSHLRVRHGHTEMLLRARTVPE